MGQPQGFYMFSHSCFNSGNCPKYFLHYFLFFQIQTFIVHGYSYRSDPPLFVFSGFVQLFSILMDSPPRIIMVGSFYLTSHTVNNQLISHFRWLDIRFPLENNCGVISSPLTVEGLNYHSSRTWRTICVVRPCSSKKMKMDLIKLFIQIHPQNIVLMCWKLDVRVKDHQWQNPKNDES